MSCHRPTILRRTLALAALALIGGSATTATAATPPALAATVNAWVAAHPQTGIYVARLDGAGAHEVVSYKPDVPRRPASTMKVITAAAALMSLGPDYRFRTRLWAPTAPAIVSGTITSPIYLVGSGDPMLATPTYATRYLRGAGTKIDQITAQLARQGVRRINGALIVDESRFDGIRRVGSWPARYVIECTPLSAVNVNQGYLLDKRTLYVKRPPLAAGSKFRAALARSGITHRGTVSTGRAPATGVVIAQSTSAPLRATLRIMLKQSDNYVAETVTKNLGAQIRGLGTTANGTAAARSLLSAYLSPSDRLVDGSGLDRTNALTPRSMVRVLRAANQNPVWGTPLLGGLASGGEGTLKKRFLEPWLRSRVHAKTGYINSTTTIAGIVDSVNGKRYAFALYMNDSAITAGRATQDRIVTLLASGVADNS